MELFILLKIILLQYFQFSTISGIQTDSKRNILLIIFLHNKNNRSITCDYALINYKCSYLFIQLLQQVKDA